jgi:carbon monoxide dehydrogenase subunit G
MKFENTFEVDAPIDEVYAALLDVERVAPCVPGAEVLDQTGDDNYQVAIKVKVGPISMTYKGNVEIVERDEASHRAVMRARARETRGQGTADARVTMALTADGERHTKGTMQADVQLAGRAAAMGRGVIQDVSAKIVSTFSANLEAMLSGRGAVAEPAAAGAGAAGAGAATGDAAVAGTGAPAAAGAGPGAAAAAGAGQTTTPVGDGAAAGAPAASTEPPAPSSTPPTPARGAVQPAEESALPVGQIVGSVLAERLRDPKVLGGLAAGLLVVFTAVRRLRNR